MKKFILALAALALASTAQAQFIAVRVGGIGVGVGGCGNVGLVHQQQHIVTTQQFVQEVPQLAVGGCGGTAVGFNNFGFHNGFVGGVGVRVGHVGVGVGRVGAVRVRHF